MSRLLNVYLSFCFITLTEFYSGETSYISPTDISRMREFNAFIGKGTDLVVWRETIRVKEPVSVILDKIKECK